MAVDSVERAIGRLEGKLDSVIKLVGDLGASFDAMEKGRLSRLEVQFATLNTEVEAKAKLSSIWYAALMSIFSAVISGTILFFVL